MREHVKRSEQVEIDQKMVEFLKKGGEIKEAVNAEFNSRRGRVNIVINDGKNSNEFKK